MSEEQTTAHHENHQQTTSEAWQEQVLPSTVQRKAELFIVTMAGRSEVPPHPGATFHVKQ